MTARRAKPPPALELPDDQPIRVGVSACILGQEVRFNGGHKLDHFVRDILGEYVEFVPMCPEVEIGLGTPRETIRLVSDTPEDPDSIRLLAPKSGLDHTEKMLAYAREKCRALAGLDLQGFILQKGSPSCGMERVKVHPVGGGMSGKQGQGLFARTLMESLPYLPVEEDGRLNDPRLRENFIERIFAYRRIRNLFRSSWTVGQLVAFHSREKLLLLAHDRPTYTALGKLVAGAKTLPRKQVAEDYERIFMTGMKKIATTRKQVNVLQHVAGHFKSLLEEADRLELHEVIERYRLDEVPLVVPVTLLRHHVRRHGLEYLAAQTWLDPHPRELKLRNHV